MPFCFQNRIQLLAIFDVEGVLYDAEFLPVLAEKINKENEIWDITKKGIQGLINWEDGLTKRVDLLKGISYETCIEVANSLPIMSGAKETCSALKQAGWKILAVSGGFTIMTDRLLKELHLDYVFSNELLFKDGKLDGQSTWWNKTGQKIRQKNYKNGKLDGKSTLWNKRGQKIRQKNYKNGKLDGKFIEWFQFNGEIKREENYKNGEICLKEC